MAKPEELQKIREAFTPVVSIEAFQDTGSSIVAKVRQDYLYFKLTQVRKVIMDKKTGAIGSIDRVLS